MKSILLHNHDNYNGLTAKIDSLPHVVQYVGPYSPQVYQAANQIQKGGSGVPYTGNIISAANQVLTSQPKATTGAAPTVAPTPNNDLINQLNSQQDETNRLIDETYNSNYDYLNRAENALKADYPTVQGEITGQYDAANRQALGTKTSSLAGVDEQQIMAEQRNNSVVADARRLYDQLQRGYRARFGGASSAGQAASEIAAVELQRNLGRNQLDYNNTLRQFDTTRTSISQKYEDQLFQLGQARDSAMNQARRDFDQKMLQIQSSRNDTNQAKSQAKLSALQNLRDKIYQINLQNEQFKQTIQAQKTASDASLANYMQQLSSDQAMAQNAFGTYNSATPITSNLQVGQTTSGANTSPLTGVINKGRKTLDDALDDASGFISNLFD